MGGVMVMWKLPVTWLPDGYQLWETEDYLKLYCGEELIGIYSVRADWEQIRRDAYFHQEGNR